MVVQVIARQWSWLFQYENGAKDSELRVPVGKPVKLILLLTRRDPRFLCSRFSNQTGCCPGDGKLLMVSAYSNRDI